MGCYGKGIAGAEVAKTGALWIERRFDKLFKINALNAMAPCWRTSAQPCHSRVWITWLSSEVSSSGGGLPERPRPERVLGAL